LRHRYTLISGPYSSHQFLDKIVAHLDASYRRAWSIDSNCGEPMPVRVSIKIIACVYALIGVAAASQWLYAILIGGRRGISTGLLDGLLPLGLAYGLVTYRPWGRTLGLVFSGLLGFVGGLGLILWLVHVIWGLGEHVSGLIVERPVAAPIVMALLIVLSAWQWWLLTRPQIAQLFSANPP